MTEAALEKLLARATTRVRLARALRWGLAGFALSLACAASIIFCLRWQGLAEVPAAWLAACPGVLALLCATAGFFSAKISTLAVAGQIDQCAQTQEQLVTWAYLRERPIPATGLSAGFKAAQNTAALRAADTVELTRDVPVNLPRWSRALWLALIVFISAVLTPAAIPTSNSTLVSEESASYSGQQTGGGDAGDSRNALLNSVREIPRVQVLSPAQLRKLELIATDTRLSAAMQADALKELLGAIGATPESELTPDVKQLLETLRKNAGSAAIDKTAGSQPGIVGSNTEKSKPAAAETAAEYKAFEHVEKGWSSGAGQYADVKTALRKYYEK